MLNPDPLKILTEVSRNLRVCVIIPTKNRPQDLQHAVQSLFAQTCIPGSVVIIDQSPDDTSQLLVEAELADAQNRRGTVWRLQYIHDPAIDSLPMARNRAMAIADGDIWLFLDDDVVLEPDFVEQLLAAYRDNPEVGGVSGIITNYPRSSLAFRLWSGLFMRGPFHDERQPIYWQAERLRNSPPIIVSRFTGCLMSFRADTVRGHWFDENLRGVSDGEDADFCIQLGATTKLTIAPSARLEHRHSTAERLHDHWLRRSVRGNLFLYHKNWNTTSFNLLCYGWLLSGYGLVAVIASARRFSLEPWRALLTGAQEGRQAAHRVHNTPPSRNAARADPAQPPR